MKDKQAAVLQAVAKFEPLSKEELEASVPECNPWEVRHAADELQEQGLISIDTGEYVVNRDPMNSVSEGQTSLFEGSADSTELVKSHLPSDIEVESEISLELSEEQALLFEKMRADVSRDCGYMSRLEFVDWLLREARRMTTV